MKKLFIIILLGCTSAAVAPLAAEEAAKNALYSEEMIALDYKDAEISTVLKSLAAAYNLNLVATKDIKGKVTISLKDVTLHEALRAILVVNGYSYSQTGNIIYISPGPGPEGLDLNSEFINLKYANAAESEKLLQKAISAKGDIRVDAATNSLIITDYPTSMDKVKKLIREIDVPPIQVLIEAKIVDITNKDLQNLGVKYTANYEHDGLFTTNKKKADSGETVDTGVNLSGPSTSLSAGQFTFDMHLEHADFTATLDALIQDEKAHLLASPSIATLNNKEARIIIGEKVPFKEKTQTTTGTTETTKFVDVGTTLRVTPQVNADGYITMIVHPEVSSVKTLLDAGPQITTREADATIRVKEGQTIVIGGLIKNEETRVRNRVPILGYVPILGFFFSNRAHDITQVELAVFITPHIIRDQAGQKLAADAARDEVFVNIEKTAELTIVARLFEKARNLETNNGIESRRKDSDFRLRQAASIYDNIASQFPRSNKADAALYRLGWIYLFDFNDYPKAREYFKQVVTNYPQSEYYGRANRHLRFLNKALKPKTPVKKNFNP